MRLAACVGALGALLFCLPSPVGGEDGEFSVDISGKSLTLTCPSGSFQWQEKNGNAYSDLSNAANFANQSVTFMKEEELKKIEMGKEYSCEESKSIYLKARVCEGCVELSVGLVAGIVAADVLITLGVLFLAYYCSKNRAAGFGGGSARGGARGRPRGQKVDRPPPVPNPDYEPIRKGQREVYAGLEHRAF